LAGQIAELTAAGCAKVYREKVSGAKTDRAKLAKVKGRLESGDVLVAEPENTGRKTGTAASLALQT
jgi:Resolvase, N terminal domain